jgi:hypothetical protein
MAYVAHRRRVLGLPATLCHSGLRIAWRGEAPARHLLSDKIPTDALCVALIYLLPAWDLRVFRLFAHRSDALLVNIPMWRSRNSLTPSIWRDCSIARNIRCGLTGCENRRPC